MELVATRRPNVLNKPLDADEAVELSEAFVEIIGSWTLASPPAGR